MKLRDLVLALQLRDPDAEVYGVDNLMIAAPGCATAWNLEHNRGMNLNSIEKIELKDAITATLGDSEGLSKCAVIDRYFRENY